MQSSRTPEPQNPQTRKPLAAPGGPWNLLAAPGGPWRRLAAPGGPGGALEKKMFLIKTYFFLGTCQDGNHGEHLRYVLVTDALTEGNRILEHGSHGSHNRSVPVNDVLLDASALWNMEFLRSSSQCSGYLCPD